MAPYHNLTGLRFGKLQVLNDTGKRRHNKVVWLCRCDCGNTREVIGSQLTTELTYECEACAKLSHQDNAAGHNIKHSLNNVYYHMKDRCENPKCDSYPYYGGRGISICKEWSESLDSFRDWATNNGYKHGLTIDRIDVNGNYCPENCRWVPFKEQGFNRRDNIYVHYRGKKFSLAKICEDLNLPREKIRKYIKTNLKYAQQEEPPAITSSPAH